MKVRSPAGAANLSQFKPYGSPPPLPMMLSYNDSAEFKLKETGIREFVEAETSRLFALVLTSVEVK
jgi:hypothetical protein